VWIGELAALGGALTWAISSVLLTRINRNVHVMAIGAVRCLSSSTFFWLLLPVSGGLGAFAGLNWDTILGLMLSVLIVLGVGDTIFFLATKRIGVSRARPLSMTYPLFTVAMAFVFLGERVSAVKGAGALLILAGVYVLSARRRATPATPVGTSDLPGIAFALLAAVCWAAGTVILTPFSHELGAVATNCIRQPTAAILFLALMPRPTATRELRALTRREWLTLIGGGLIGSGLGALLYIWSLRYAGASISAVLSAASPLFSTPLSMWLLGEKVNRSVAIGTATIIAGVWLVILG
jgi:drug/metabolite transporter (DMT)-like permease